MRRCTHNADRVDGNLGWLAVAYVRMLGTVGGEGWNDRGIDPVAPSYSPLPPRS